MSGDGAAGPARGLRILAIEFRRRNVSALGVDVLYVFTTAFLATLAVRGLWPAAIAALPLATFLYFAWKSTRAFFLANLAAVALSVGATEAGFVPL